MTTLTSAIETNAYDRRCPGCGSFLDAARINPLTGMLAHKCAACLEWRSPATARIGGPTDASLGSRSTAAKPARSDRPRA
jgi:hypothetical protein